MLSNLVKVTRSAGLRKDLNREDLTSVYLVFTWVLTSDLCVLGIYMGSGCSCVPPAASPGELILIHTDK